MSASHEAEIIPGELFLREEPILLNPGRMTVTLNVANTGDRPIQIGSHFHFFEVNRALHFDRPSAYGMRLDIAAGSGVRFEPGESRPVSLVPFAGTREIWGGNALVQGYLDQEGARDGALERARLAGFFDLPAVDQSPSNTA